METPEDISAKTSLALNQVSNIADDETRASVTLLTEIINRMVETLTAQETSLISLTERIDVLERQITDLTPDVPSEPIAGAEQG